MLDAWESVVRSVAVAVAAIAIVGSAREASARARAGRGAASGLARRFRVGGVYLLGAVPYFALCSLLWRSLGVSVGPVVRTALLLVGSLLGAGGGLLYVFGRRQLGEMYNLSSALGSELYADQRLVTGGLYRRVRHPMYLGLAVSALGALFVFRTWTFVFVLATFPLIVFKARQEERLLAERFGPLWDSYAARVPGWMPLRTAKREVRDVDAFRG